MDNLSIDTGALLEKLQAIGVEFGIKIISALAIFVIGRIIVRIMMSAMRKVMVRIGMDTTLQIFLSNILSVLLTLVVVLAALSQLGVQMTSFIAILGAAGLAVGLALQGSLANFAAGVMIIFFRPYKAGEYIEAAGTAGTVEAVTIFNTILKTPDNRKVVVPNSNITSGPITNFSAHDTRRIDLIIGVGYDDDLKVTEQAIREVIGAESRVLKEPAPIVAVESLGDSSVNFVVRPWVKTSDYWPIRWALIQAIKEKLDAVGVTIPYPQRDVHLYQSGSKD